jgi:hypothetical protein
MRSFRKPVTAKTTMFAVNYDDGRAAYLWVEGHGKGSDDRIVVALANQRKQQGLLPEGTIASIKRVR